jgi:hypothetical protein
VLEVKIRGTTEACIDADLPDPVIEEEQGGFSPTNSITQPAVCTCFQFFPLLVHFKRPLLEQMKRVPTLAGYPNWSQGRIQHFIRN